jgi:hypothetical protein
LFESDGGRGAYFFSADTAWAWRPALRRLILDRFAAAPGAAGGSAPVLVKEPNGSLAAPLLLQTLPRSRLLFVVRDGRDVVDSMVDGASEGWITATHGTTLAAAERTGFIERRAHHWVRAVDAVQRAYAVHDPARRYQVTYEALLADTEGRVGQILRWLGQEGALAAVPEVVGRLSFSNMPAERTGRGQFARAATPGLWRDHFTEDEQHLLASIMGPTLAGLGYD